MTTELAVQLRGHFAPAPLPSVFGGKMAAFRLSGTRTLERPDYDVTSQRGGFSLGELRWSNQWGEYAWRGLPGDTPVNGAIIAEVYAALRDLNRREGVGSGYPGWRPRGERS